MVWAGVFIFGKTILTVSKNNFTFGNPKIKICRY